MSLKAAITLFTWIGLCAISGRFFATVQGQEEWDVSWKWDLFFDETVSYDSNVFKLSDGSIDRFEDDRPGDKISGRYDDMDSVEDFVLSSRLELVAKGNARGGSEMRIIPSLEVDYFTQNERRSHPTFGFSVEHEIARRKFSLDLDYRLDVFSRNYLADAIDPTGRVSASERVYESGVYDKASVEMTYRHRLWKRPKKATSFLDARRLYGTVSGGYSRRFYESPFSNRDRHSATVGLSLFAEFGKSWDLKLSYEFDFVSTGSDREVLVRDEADFGVDFNGDGDTIDAKRRTEQRVDRSRLDHFVGLRLRYEIAKRWTASVGYDVLFQDFLSNQRFDTTHRNRQDFRQRVRAAIEWDFAKKWSLEVGGQWTLEEISRAGLVDEDDEETEYDRFVVFVALTVQLF